MNTFIAKILIHVGDHIEYVGHRIDKLGRRIFARGVRQLVTEIKKENL